MMKRIFTAIAVCGFILALGIAGTSDLEAETGRQLMTNAEFYTRIAISLVMLLGGSIGSKLCRPYRPQSRHTGQQRGHTSNITDTVHK